MIRLVKLANGSYCHSRSDTVWARTDYSGLSLECLYECSECGDVIVGEHYMNLDDGQDNVHLGCALVTSES